VLCRNVLSSWNVSRMCGIVMKWWIWRKKEDTWYSGWIRDEIIMEWRERLFLSTATSYINMNFMWMRANTCFHYSQFHFHLCDRSMFVGRFFSVTALRCCATFMMAHVAPARLLVAPPLWLLHVLWWFSPCTAATSWSLLGCRSGHLPHLVVERVGIWGGREWLLGASKRTWVLKIEVVSAQARHLEQPVCLGSGRADL
jgi:hypothetical protein